MDEIDVGKLHEGMPAQIKVGRAPRRQGRGEDLQDLPQVQDGRGGDALRRGDRASARQGRGPPRRLLRQRRHRGAREGERAAGSRAPGDLRRRQGHVEVPGVGDAEPVKRAIKVGLSDGLNVEVAEGLKEKDRSSSGRRRRSSSRSPPSERYLDSLSFLRQMLQDVRHQKASDVLTLLGITWGTVSVSLLVSFGEGLQKRIVKNQRGLGENIVIAWPSRTSIPFEGLGKGRPDPGRRGRYRGPAPRDPRGDLLRRIRAGEERLPARARADLCPDLGQQHRLRRHAQHHPRRGRPLRQRPRHRPPPARGLPGDKLKQDLFGDRRTRSARPS